MKLVSWLILSSGNQRKCLTVTPFCHALVLRLKKEFSRACMRCRNTAAFIVNKKTWVIKVILRARGFVLKFNM